jgi:hypothetical protein
MHTVNKLSYVIAFNQTIDNITILNKQLQWLSAFQNIEVILVEYGQNYPTLSDKMGVTYKYLKVDETYYSRAKAWNIGLRYSGAEYVAFSTPDTIMLHQSLDKAMKL